MFATIILVRSVFAFHPLRIAVDASEPLFARALGLALDDPSPKKDLVYDRRSYMKNECRPA